MNHDLTQGKPSSVLWRFCLPLFGSVFFQQLYNLADSLVAGRFVGEGEEKTEQMDFWFAGFYPAVKPAYTIVVLQDEQTEPGESCAGIFAEICNAIYLLKSD